MLVRTTTTKAAQNNPNLSARQVVNYTEIKHNLLYDPNDGHQHHPDYASRKGIISRRERWAASHVKKKEYKLLAADQIPESCRSMPVNYLDDSRQTELFIRQLENGDYLCCLLSEIHRLQHADLFGDGTFDDCNSLAGFHQIWIISYMAVFAEGRQMAYPLIFVLMQNRRTQDYDLVLNEIKQLYYEQCQEQLRPKTILVDFERAAINSLEKAFDPTETKVLLCTVHFMRNLQRKLRLINGKWFKNKFLVYAYRLSKGLPFLPMEKEENQRVFWAEMEKIKSVMPTGEQDNLDEYTNYMKEYYFQQNNNNSYKFPNWCHYNTMEAGYLTTSTNPQEGLNNAYGIMKRKRGRTGKMIVPTVLQNIYKFKYEMMKKKADASKEPKTLDKQRLSTIQNMQERDELISEFNDFAPYLQSEKIITFLQKFANVTKETEVVFSFEAENFSL